MIHNYHCSMFFISFFSFLFLSYYIANIAFIVFREREEQQQLPGQNWKITIT